MARSSKKLTTIRCVCFQEHQIKNLGTKFEFIKNARTEEFEIWWEFRGESRQRSPKVVVDNICACTSLCTTNHI